MPGSDTSAKRVLPTDGELVQEVVRHSDGIDAVSLGEKFESQGYAKYNVQRAIRHALDRGVLELGPKLRLYHRQSAA